jgi:hypothetical protein
LLIFLLRDSGSVARALTGCINARHDRAPASMSNFFRSPRESATPRPASIRVSQHLMERIPMIVLHLMTMLTVLLLGAIASDDLHQGENR